MLGQMMEPVEMTGLPNYQASKYKKPWALTGCNGRHPNITKSFYLAEGDLEKFNLALQNKYSRIRLKEQKSESFLTDDAKLVIVAYGTMARLAKNAVKQLRSSGKKVGLVRPITLWPFPANAFIRNNETTKQRITYLVIEMSYGQMIEDVKLSLSSDNIVEFLGRSGGGIPTDQEIIKKVDSLL
jgi:2-oxoglutarate ferredoxin oxidoreductase subunit alpha